MEEPILNSHNKAEYEPAHTAGAYPLRRLHQMPSQGIVQRMEQITPSVVPIVDGRTAHR